MGGTKTNTLIIPFSYYTVCHPALEGREKQNSLACLCCNHSFPAFSLSEKPDFSSLVVEIRVNESKSLSSSPAIAWLDWTSLRSPFVAMWLLDERYGKDKLLTLILTVIDRVTAFNIIQEKRNLLFCSTTCFYWGRKVGVVEVAYQW